MQQTYLPIDLFTPDGTRFLAASAICAIGLLLTRRLSKNRSPNASTPLFVSNLEPYKHLEPTPDLTFDLASTEPPRYRAFRYSYKRHTIDVRKLDQNSWVILDKDWPLYHRIRTQRLRDRGDHIVKTLPSARAAAHEVCQDLCEFLSRRYPQIYRIERTGKDGQEWNGRPSITKVEMPALGVSYDLTNEDPLTVAGLVQPADINLLVAREDGKYVLSAMMLGIGGGQRIKDKLGKTLADLHLNGHVPHYASQLERPLDRYLSKLKPEGPIQRNTTAISTHEDFHWPSKTMGPEDDWDPVIRGPGVNTPSYGFWTPPGPISSVSELWFRQERQTLRRLPRSGAICWMVHTYIERMEDVAQEPGVPGRLASHIRSWDEELAKHKGRHLYEHVLLPYLDDLHQRQVQQGVCEDGELPSNFPW